MTTKTHPALGIVGVALLALLPAPTAHRSCIPLKSPPRHRCARAEWFRAIAGKRVGLLTHPAGVNRDGRSSIDVLRSARNVQLVALFGPEHGIYGDEKANVPVDDKIDARTGFPVYSLYGKYRKPTPKMLAGLDALVIDLQDVGVRSYTYVSCMRYVMEACFEYDVEVIVLDRPNPLGGLKVGWSATGSRMAQLRGRLPRALCPRPHHRRTRARPRQALHRLDGCLRQSAQEGQIIRHPDARLVTRDALA